MDSGLCAVFQVDVNYRVERHFKTNKGRAVGKSIEYEMVTLIEVADDNKSVVVKDGMTKRRYTLTEDSFPFIKPLKDLSPRKARKSTAGESTIDSVTESCIVDLPIAKTCKMCENQYAGGHILFCQTCHGAWAEGMKMNKMNSDAELKKPTQDVGLEEPISKVQKITPN